MVESAESPDLDLLLRRAASGDPHAERLLVEHFAPRIRAMALARTRDHDLARDLTQETLVALVLAFRKGQVRDHDRVTAFVAGVARNVINNHKRRRLRHPEAQLDENAVDFPAPSIDDADTAERRAMLAAALAELGPADREVLRLTLVEGLKSGEIAKRIGVSAEVARTRKSRALKRILDVMADRSRNAPGGHLQE